MCFLIICSIDIFFLRLNVSEVSLQHPFCIASHEPNIRVVIITV
jgi:hypothetical protein